ncbi:hypothetical protein [Runella sp.]|uniref:hypothetical protein n=1 Tax=Runella sp. TaxID=1960881 RepID=UPI003D0D730D
MRIIYALIAVSFAVSAIAQNQSTPAKKKGNLYFNWSYNREWYSKSTIRFKNTTTDNYDFTFIDAKAHDSADMHEFWRITRLTIPQYNMSLGYFFKGKHNLGVEVAWNHLKYVVTDNQVIHVRGNIRGRYIDKDTLVTPNFVHLQHTNGNNYLLFNLTKRHQLWHTKNLQLSGIGKVGVGPLVSYTISTILGDYDSGRFHLQGWVTGVSGGLRLDIYRRFFVQSDFQAAFANYTGSELGSDHVGRATHHFFSWQGIYGFGANFYF